MGPKRRGVLTVGFDLPETDAEKDDYVTAVSGDIVIAGYTRYETIEERVK